MQSGSYLLQHSAGWPECSLIKASEAGNLQVVPAPTGCQFHSEESTTPLLPAGKRTKLYVSSKNRKRETYTFHVKVDIFLLLIFCLREWIQAFATLPSSRHYHWWRATYALLQQPPISLSDWNSVKKQSDTNISIP